MSNSESKSSSWSDVIKEVVRGAFWTAALVAGIGIGIKFADVRTQYHLERIQNLEKDLSSEISRRTSLEKEKQKLSESLSAILASKVILKDTLYESGAVSILNGAISITCDYVDLAPGSHGVNLRIKSIDGSLKGGWSNYYFLGDLVTIPYQNKKYILNILDVREFNSRPGVNIAVYRE